MDEACQELRHAEGVGTGPTDTPGDNIDPYDEIDKIPELTGAGVDNANEGDPDFKNDLSRIYLSMNTDGDSNLSLAYPDTGESWSIKALCYCEVR